MIVWGEGREGMGGLDFLHAEVFLLLGFEFLSGFDVGLKICIVHVGLARAFELGRGELRKEEEWEGGKSDVPV